MAGDGVRVFTETAGEAGSLGGSGGGVPASRSAGGWLRDGADAWGHGQTSGQHTGNIYHLIKAPAPGYSCWWSDSGPVFQFSFLVGWEMAPNGE